MTINHKIYDFPNVPVKSQLFHVPGAAYDGGFTSGGARMLSPEPGGRAVLEMQIALQITEWGSPLSSWLMSKINGEIFRIKLTKTPQLIRSSALGLIENAGIPWAAEGLYSQPAWDNSQLWSNDFAFPVTSVALEGSTSVSIDMMTFGEIFKHGHVIGIHDNSYIILDIEYTDNVANLTVSPPLRRNVNLYDLILTEPYFTGNIANGNEMRVLYEANNVGYIQPNRIIFQEVIV